MMGIEIKPIDINNLPIKNLLIVCLTAFCLYSVKSCSDKGLEIERTEGQWKFKYAMMSDSFKVENNNLGEQVAFQEQLIISEKDANALLAMENSGLKKLKSSTKVITRTEIKEIFIPFNNVSEAKVATYIGEEGDTIKYTPKTFLTPSNKWYSIGGRVMRDGVNIDSVHFVNEFTTNIGWKKDKGIKNILKSKYAVVETINKNPYTEITGVKNVIVAPPKSKRISIGPQIGITYSGGQFVPTVGVGVQFNLIRF